MIWHDAVSDHRVFVMKIQDFFPRGLGELRIF
jgi:hypothetical protein